LLRYLGKQGAFRFTVEEFRFVLEGEEIYRNDSMTESLPFLMHRNGLRELWFEEGLSYRELTDLLMTFRSYEILKDSYEDLVTLLWDKEFSSIHFLATDDFLWDPVEIPTNAKNVTERMEMPMGEQKQVEYDMTRPRWLFRSGELNDLRKEIPQEIEGVDYINLVTTLAEMISHSGEDRERFERIVGFLRVVLDRLLVLRDFNNLIKILSFSRILLDDRRLDAGEEEFIQLITDYLSESQSIERLVASLERSEDFEPQQLEKYLLLLSDKATAPLCEAWLRMESPEGRRIIPRALVQLGKDHIPTLSVFLKHNQWQLVSMVIDTLAKIGRQECVYCIAQVKRHERAEVRRQALHALSRFSPHEFRILKNLLVGFLADQEGRIRVDASKIVVKKLGAEALSYLRRCILSEEFMKRSLDEKRAFLKAVGRIEAPESVQTLEEVLYRNAYSTRAQRKEMRSCIQRVLASMDLDEAKAALATLKTRQEKWFFRLGF
jgi:HEAT repeat protein